MPKKKPAAAATVSSVRQRGLKCITIPMPPAVVRAVALATELSRPTGDTTRWSMIRWCTAVLEAEARQVLEAAGQPWPGEVG